MGLLDFSSNKALQKKVSEEIVMPFFYDARNKVKSEKTGFLIKKFEEAISNLDVLKIAIYCMKKWGGSGDLFNIYDSAAKFVPEQDVIKVANLIYSDNIFPIVASANYDLTVREFLNPLAERCPISERPQLFTILENSNILLNAMPHSTGASTTKFYYEICKGRNDTEALARLGASPSWNSLNHRDNIFVQWLDGRDSRLLAALRQ